MNEEEGISENPIAKLAEYWNAANLMYLHVEEFREEPGIFNLIEEGLFFDFKAYLNFWLSSLYVVAEGFLELKLKDPHLESLIRENFDSLRKFRNGTFHFQNEYNKQMQFFGGVDVKLNWAVELHEGFREYFVEKLKP